MDSQQSFTERVSQLNRHNLLLRYQICAVSWGREVILLFYPCLGFILAEIGRWGQIWEPLPQNKRWMGVYCLNFKMALFKIPLLIAMFLTGQSRCLLILYCSMTQPPTTCCVWNNPKISFTPACWGNWPKNFGMMPIGGGKYLFLPIRQTSSMISSWRNCSG